MSFCRASSSKARESTGATPAGCYNQVNRYQPVTGSLSTTAHCSAIPFASAEWVLVDSPVPDRSGKVRKQRESAATANGYRNQCDCREFGLLETRERSPENRGVPGSSPGLAIDEVRWNGSPWTAPVVPKRSESAQAGSGRRV